MGLFKEHFHWRALAIWPLTVVGILLAISAAFRFGERFVLAGLFLAAAAVFVIIRAVHAAVISQGSMSNRVTFALVCSSAVIALCLLLVIFTSPRADAWITNVVLTNDSGPNAIGVNVFHQNRGGADAQVEVTHCMYLWPVKDVEKPEVRAGIEQWRLGDRRTCTGPALTGIALANDKRTQYWTATRTMPATLRTAFDAGDAVVLLIAEVEYNDWRPFVKSGARVCRWVSRPGKPLVNCINGEARW
jgi:hypothetical protein